MPPTDDMVSKLSNGHTIAVEWMDGECRYRVYVDDSLVGYAETASEARKIADNHIASHDARVLKVKLDESAYEPVRAHPSDAGLDLKSTRTFWLHPGHQEYVDTGVHVQIPSGYVGLLTSKSGLMKSGITTRGTIDSGFTGSIGVVMYNHGKEGVKVEEGMKITQLVILPVITPVIEIVDELEDTERGDGGFGSTGR